MTISNVTQIENELGRTITVAADVLDTGDVEIAVSGPNSETTNLLTRKEAEALYLVLGLALNPLQFSETTSPMSPSHSETT